MTTADGTLLQAGIRAAERHGYTLTASSGSTATVSRPDGHVLTLVAHPFGPEWRHEHGGSSKSGLGLDTLVSHLRSTHEDRE